MRNSLMKVAVQSQFFFTQLLLVPNLPIGNALVPETLFQKPWITMHPSDLNPNVRSVESGSRIGDSKTSAFPNRVWEREPCRKQNEKHRTVINHPATLDS